MGDKLEMSELKPQRSTSASDIAAILQTAIDHLQWISESEYPFETFDWSSQAISELTDKKLLELTQHPLDANVETQDLGTFFEVVTQPQDWYGDEEIATMKQYQQLVATLKQHLTNLKVYRLGEINLDIYIVGQTPDSHLAGIATKAVET